MNKYIAIYHDGSPIVKPDLDSVFSLPGNYYAFSLGDTLEINHKNGVVYYEKDKQQGKFKINHLELISIERFNNNWTPFQFAIYNHKSDTVKKLYPTISNIFEYQLGFVAKTMISASQFKDWETYDAVTKIEEYKAEITNLKAQVDALKKVNEELVNKFAALPSQVL